MKERRFLAVFLSSALTVCPPLRAQTSNAAPKVQQKALAQQQQEPEDPEDEKQIGMWLDQGLSASLVSQWFVN
jgi:hypothetical protein